MYFDMARYDAFTWWSAFPSFLVRSLYVDRPPPPYLGDADQARRFFEQRLGRLTRLSRCCLDRYGSLVPFLFGVGLLGGLWHPQSRLLTGLLAGYLVYYAAAMLLVLPEAKHASPLLLPLHVLAAAGWWIAARHLALAPDGGEPPYGSAEARLRPSRCGVDRGRLGASSAPRPTPRRGASADASSRASSRSPRRARMSLPAGSLFR